MMSIPRNLTLRRHGDKYDLHQRPVVSFYEYIQKQEKFTFKDHEIEENDLLLKEITAGSCLIRVSIENINAHEFGIDILKIGENKTRIGYLADQDSLFINRKESGNVGFHDAFGSIETAPIRLENNRLNLDIIVDQSVVEVFAADGSKVITDQVFPGENQEEMQLYSRGGTARVVNLEVYRVR
jgi:sucrose-6-phosphate hydrolase SacC (GH32 family)